MLKVATEWFSGNAARENKSFVKKSILNNSENRPIIS